MSCCLEFSSEEYCQYSVQSGGRHGFLKGFELVSQQHIRGLWWSPYRSERNGLVARRIMTGWPGGG